MELIFATHNQHKLDDVSNLLTDKVKLINLSSINFNQEIKETGSTFRENALIKSKIIYDITKKSVFADDSGLVIPSLNNEPGVFSARYAGTGKAEDNINLILKKLGDSNERNAYFISVFCLILNGKIFFFEGRVDGKISNEIKGKQGFGYDPIFVPNDSDISFAEMTHHQKNSMSHRAKALQSLNYFLEKNI